MSTRIINLLPVIFLLVLSMFPIHSIPPVISNSLFLERSQLSINYLSLYTAIYYVGFFIVGVFFIFSKFKVSASVRTITVSTIIWALSYYFSLNHLSEEWLIACRAILGGACFLLYAQCFMLIFVSFNGLAAYSSLFAIGTMFLDSFAFLNGASIEFLPYSIATYVFSFLPFFLVTYVLIYVNFFLKNESTIGLSLDFHGVIKEMRTTMPSILINVAFFLFLYMLPLLNIPTITSFHIGMCILSLSVAFPLGAKLSHSVYNKLGMINSLKVYTLIALIGICFFSTALEIHTSITLILGAMFMAFGNAGILVINTFDASKEKVIDNAKPQVAYMLATSLVTIILINIMKIFDSSNQSITLVMGGIYIFLILIFLTRKTIEVKLTSY